MYVILFGGASFAITQTAYAKSLREASRLFRWHRGQYTYCVFRSY